MATLLPFADSVLERESNLLSARGDATEFMLGDLGGKGGATAAGVVI